MKKVVWSNVWNWTHSGGHGSRVHLTNDTGLTGKTLCGKEFPRCKGAPIAAYGCKRCWKKAGMTNAEFSALEWSPNAVD